MIPACALKVRTVGEPSCTRRLYAKSRQRHACGRLGRRATLPSDEALSIATGIISYQYATFTGQECFRHMYGNICHQLFTDKNTDFAFDHSTRRIATSAFMSMCVIDQLIEA